MSEAADRLLMQNDQVRYRGECIAVVVADSFVAAREAATLVKASVRLRRQSGRIPLTASFMLPSSTDCGTSSY